MLVAVEMRNLTLKFQMYQTGGQFQFSNPRDPGFGRSVVGIELLHFLDNVCNIRACKRATDF